MRPKLFPNTAHHRQTIHEKNYLQLKIKTLCWSIISHIEEMWTHKTSLTPPHFSEVSVPCKESGEYRFFRFRLFFYWISELFRQSVIFCFSFFYYVIGLLSDMVIRRNVNTVLRYHQHVIHNMPHFRKQNCAQILIDSGFISLGHKKWVLMTQGSHRSSLSHVTLEVFTMSRVTYDLDPYPWTLI